MKMETEKQRYRGREGDRKVGRDMEVKETWK